MDSALCGRRLPEYTHYFFITHKPVPSNIWNFGSFSHIFESIFFSFGIRQLAENRSLILFKLWENHFKSPQSILFKLLENLFKNPQLILFKLLEKSL